jgi:hypothetical protein
LPAGSQPNINRHVVALLPVARIDVHPFVVEPDGTGFLTVPADDAVQQEKQVLDARRLSLTFPRCGRRSGCDHLSKLHDAHAQSHKQTAEALSHVIKHLAAPKKIIRDPKTNRAMRSETVLQ